MSRYLLGLAAFVVASTAQSSYACQKAGGRWWLGSDTSATWIVKPGETCTATLTLNNGASVIDEIKIIGRAKFGLAGTNGHTSYAYQAAKNHAGADQFEVMITGERNGSRGRTKIKVDIDIRP